MPPDPMLSQIREVVPELPDALDLDGAIAELLRRHRANKVRLAARERALESMSNHLLGYAAGSDVASLDISSGDELVDAISLGLNMMVEELRFQNQQIDAARKAAEAADTAKSAFLANMSHELRTPLNAIIGYSELIIDDADHEGLDAIADDSRQVLKASRHLLRLISDILDLSKVEAGHADLVLEEVELGGLLADLAATARPLVQEGANTLVVECPEALAFVCDATKLQQILLNLVSNAAKFTRNGRVTLGVFEEPHAVEFRVSDTGTGIRAERLEAIFDPFVQAEADTSRQFGGTGLGLAICKRFSEMMGGSIDVTSEVGAGTTFRVILPRRLASGTRIPTPGQARRRTEVVPADKRVVLVVDDDETVYHLVQRQLAALDCSVLWAASGNEALVMARARRPSVVTLDVLMSGLDGWDTLARLKQDADLASVPVIMMSILDDQGRGFALGAEAYLLKPIDRERLLHTVQTFLNAQDNRVLVVDDQASAREVARRILAGAGYLVDEVSNGTDALRYLEERRPDLILLDLMMPGLDGFGVVAHMADDPELATIPLVVLTAMQLTQADLDRLGVGVHAILRKGLLSHQILQRIEEALHAAR